MAGLLVGALFALLLATVPIAVSLALCTSAVFLVFYPNTAMDTMLSQAMVTSSDNFALMAIPFFMLVGSLMERSGIASRMVDVAKLLTGDMPGGLGMSAVLASMFFAAICGSGPATAAAIGGIMLPAMSTQRYPAPYGGALVAAASTIGPVIPPSIPMIMYGVTVGVSVTTLFAAGFMPGIMMGAVLMAYNYFASRRRGYRGAPNTAGLGEKLRVLSRAIPAFLMPVIVLGGIYSGIFTPTESAVVGVVYSMLVGIFGYKVLTRSLFKEALLEAGITSATIMILFGGATTFGRLLTIGKIPQMVTAFMTNLTDSPIVIMLLVNLALLVAGMFIDTISCIILFAPLFVPLLLQYGYDSLYFGVIMVVNLCIGMITPPMGGNLLVAQRVSKTTFESIFGETLPMIFMLLLSLAAMIAFPSLIMWVPRVFGMID
ncbi:MAG: TRAP transporter large permease [Planctomycetota bacterium]|jgi:C4-dicarboxylate transporter DctM subunit|nr:TRAP transporter large permease [Planctomycetota bacterium]